MAKERLEAIQGTEKEFLNLFRQLCYSRSTWQVWADLITAIACTISNAVDRESRHYEQREKEYEACIKRLGSVEIVSQIMAIIVIAFENNLEQDFLGRIYMSLELSNHWKGQYFTPYSLCQLMSEMTIEDRVREEINTRGYITINDSACGAGATLIAAANTLRKRNINFQNQAIFVGQDIDRVVGLMCYIQLSIIGCAGYIVIADTLTNPLCGTVLAPIEKEGQELWYMPMLATKLWSMRRMFYSLELCSRNIEKKVTKKEAIVQTTEKTKELKLIHTKGKNDNIVGQMDLFSMFDMN